MQHTAISVIQQLENVIKDISPDLYKTPLDLLHGSSIGMHVRHVLEFYQCLLVRDQSTVLDYDSRKRNLVYETSSAEALRAFENIKKLIGKCTDAGLKMKVNYGEQSVEIEGSVMRELIYNIEHTVHHMAIIKIALSGLRAPVNLPAEFGVAHSTLAYRQATA